MTSMARITDVKPWHEYEKWCREHAPIKTQRRLLLRTRSTAESRPPCSARLAPKRGRHEKCKQQDGALTQLNHCSDLYADIVCCAAPWNTRATLAGGYLEAWLLGSLWD